jgi:hypothetical protein
VGTTTFDDGGIRRSCARNHVRTVVAALIMIAGVAVLGAVAAVVA